MIAGPCPYCHSLRTTKKGVRKTKLHSRQVYFCTSCGRRFTSYPLPSFTYPAEAVLTSPVLFCLGYTLQQIHRSICLRFNISPSLSTVARWIAEFGGRTGAKSWRGEIISFGKPGAIVRRRIFKHHQNYLFQLHCFKHKKLLSPYPALAAYLQSLAAGKITIVPESFSLRASTQILGLNIPVPKAEKTYECNAAGIALLAANTNYHRHAVLQRYILSTDRHTIAVEVPVYLDTHETRGILGIEGGLLGHIDFLQVFGSTVVVLDYKPQASSSTKATEQLLLYAVALSRRTNVHLKQIQCAWFDENNYYRFPAMAGYSLLKTVRAHNRHLGVSTTRT
jgi:transposase-like protein